MPDTLPPRHPPGPEKPGAPPPDRGDAAAPRPGPGPGSRPDPRYVPAQGDAQGGVSGEDDAPPPVHGGGGGRRWGAWLLFLLVLATAGGGGWWWYRHHEAQKTAHAPPPPPMKVPVLAVAPRTVPIYRSFPALTEAVRTVPIQARVTGYLTERGAADGADVEGGALLYRIDPSDYQAALAQARGQLERSTAGLAYARVSQGRNQTLARDGWTSRDTADQSESTYRQSLGSLAADQAAVQAAALNLARTEIKAPFAGRISRSQVFEGSLISVAGTTLNTLVQLDPIYVSFNPAEVHLDAIVQAQSRAPVETAVALGTDRSVERNDGGFRYRGTLSFLDNQVDRLTGTILARASIANPDRTLLPGQYVTARLHLGDRDGALLVPQAAVGATQIGRTLMLLGADGKVEQRVVKLGDSYGDQVVVTEGLKPGERVITGQLQKIRPGQPVEAEAEKGEP